MGFTGKISSATSLLLGLVTFLFKLLGISLVTFEVTQKDQPAHSCDYDEANARRFTFDESPMFVPATALLFLQLTALAMSLFGMQPLAHGSQGTGLGEIMCFVLVVNVFGHLSKGCLGRENMELSTIFQSAILALLFILYSLIF